MMMMTINVLRFHHKILDRVESIGVNQISLVISSYCYN